MEHLSDCKTTKYWLFDSIKMQEQADGKTTLDTVSTKLNTVHSPINFKKIDKKGNRLLQNYQNLVTTTDWHISIKSKTVSAY